MRYLVDLEKKEIVYDEAMPAGHMIALRKVFKDKGFKFTEKKSIETMDEFNAKMHAEITTHAVQWKSGPSGPVGHQGSLGSIGLNISDMKMQEDARLRQREIEEQQRWMKQMSGSYYSSNEQNFVESLAEEISNGLPVGFAIDKMDARGIRLDAAIHKMFLHAEKKFELRKRTHPSDKSDAELKYEASKIKDEIDDVNKTSRLHEQLSRLKAKLGFL